MTTPAVGPSRLVRTLAESAPQHYILSAQASRRSPHFFSITCAMAAAAPRSVPTPRACAKGFRSQPHHLVQDRGRHPARCLHDEEPVPCPRDNETCSKASMSYREVCATRRRSSLVRKRRRCLISFPHFRSRARPARQSRTLVRNNDAETVRNRRGSARVIPA
jgi:hypothetical protein